MPADLQATDLSPAWLESVRARFANLNRLTKQIARRPNLCVATDSEALSTDDCEEPDFDVIPYLNRLAYYDRT